MLPFLKNKDDGVGVGPIEVKERKPDEDPSYDMIDAVAEDILLAVEKKDKALLKDALSALCDYLQDMDKQQDERTME